LSNNFILLIFGLIRKLNKKSIGFFISLVVFFAKMSPVDPFKKIYEYAQKRDEITVEEAQILISLIGFVFKQSLLKAGFPARQIIRLTTKFRDAGRRSAPWKPTSSRVPGRPQDGSDGNRISRWLLTTDHKFYADQKTATLSEIKYYLQALSMHNAPSLPVDTIQQCFTPWIIEHHMGPDLYLDPIQLIPIDLIAVVEDAKVIQSGHLVPLDRGGKHEPKNVFLMLARSNQLQGNLTVDELIKLMETIVTKHKADKGYVKATLSMSTAP
jgi:hypothetical protein